MKAFLGAFVILLLASCMIDPNPVESVDPPALVINEIMFNPDSVPDSRGEWFELYNPNDLEIDLNGWRVEDGSRDSFSIDVSLVIEPFGYLVFGRNGDVERNGGVDVDYEYSGMSLSNAGDEIRIVSGDGTLIDIVAYSARNGFSLHAGASIELMNPSLPNDEGMNWASSFKPYGAGDMGTPGKRNSCHKDLMVPGARLPPMLFNLIFKGSIQSGSEWVSGLDENGDQPPSVETEAEAEEGTDSSEHHEKDNVALFCDNKSQYYDHLKASLLFKLLERMSFEVRTYSDGPLTSDILDGVDLLIITNPQEAYMQSELEAIEEYLGGGGKMVLTGQYHKYISEECLNALCSAHGIAFTRTEIIDDVSNTGENYYPLVSIEEGCRLWDGGVREIHLANCCALEVIEGETILECNPSAIVIDPDGHEVPMPSCFLATSADKKVLCIGSSTIMTTALYRADNYRLLEIALSEFIMG